MHIPGHFRRVVEAVYDQVEVHQAIQYYVLTHAEDNVLLYDTDENITDCINDKLASLGIVCLAGNSKCPVMWAHYADNHKGVVFIFDTNKDPGLQGARKLKYVAKRPKITVDNIIEALYTKSATWRYENEYRVW